MQVRQVLKVLLDPKEQSVHKVRSVQLDLLAVHQVRQVRLALLDQLD